MIQDPGLARDVMYKNGKEYRNLVHQKMLGFARHRARLDSEELEWLLEVKRLQLWRDFGCATALEYLERVLAYTPHAASERLRVAFELESLPAMKSALREGELCFSAVRELTRVAEAGTEGDWIAAARGKNVRQIEDLVAHHTKGDRPNDDPDPTPKRCKLVYEELKPETLAMMREVRKQLQAEMGGARLDDDTFLQMMCRRGSEPPAEHTVTPPAHQIALTKCKLCKRTWQNGAGVDLIVDDAVLERASCDAKLLGDLEAAVPARITQSVTPRKRAQVFARDGFKCCVPGCRASFGLDIHHIDPQENGGGHELWNLCLLCGGHHTHIHEGRLTLSGRAPDGLVFQWARGTWWISSHVGREDAPSHVDREDAPSHVDRDADPFPTWREDADPSHVEREDAPSHVGRVVAPTYDPEKLSAAEMEALKRDVEALFAKLPDFRKPRG